MASCMSKRMCLVPSAQTGLPMSGLAVAGAQWRLPVSDRRLLNTIYMPWALRAGIACKDLICLDYEQHFQVRSRCARTKAFFQNRPVMSMKHNSCLPIVDI